MYLLKLITYALFVSDQKFFLVLRKFTCFYMCLVQREKTSQRKYFLQAMKTRKWILAEYFALFEGRKVPRSLIPPQRH